ncbi:MAG: hypothetical protein WC360_03955 [Opitutales bacterium]|jgi:hypothetical protein
MLSRLHVAVLVAVALFLLGARAEQARRVAAGGSYAASCGTACEFVSAGFDNSPQGPLPNPTRRLLKAAPFLVVALLPRLARKAMVPPYARAWRLHAAIRQVLRCDVVSGRLGLPPRAF